MVAVKERADEVAGGNEPSQTVLQISSESKGDETAAEDKPPSYDKAMEMPSSSLIGTVREARQEADVAVDLTGHVLACPEVEFNYTQAVSAVLPFAMLVIGAINLNSCPVQKYIPIHMIGWGILVVGARLLDTIKIRYAERNTTTAQHWAVSALDGLLNSFAIAWFIAGCVWIYGAYPPDLADPSSPNFCNENLYYFSFGVVTLVLLSLGAFAAGACCVGLLVALVTARGSSSS